MWAIMDSLDIYNIVVMVAIHSPIPQSPGKGRGNCRGDHGRLADK